MIKQTKEKTELNGNEEELAKEFIALICNLYNNDIMTKEELYECVRIGTMTDEEFADEIKELQNDLVEKMIDSLLEALGGE